MSTFFFTIITANLNSKNDLLVTAQSIEQQTFKDAQWIIYDGASTDDSLEKVKKIKLENVSIQSEPDTGIYNAWNKALPDTQGEWVIFLGAGDTFSNNHVLEDVFNWISKHTTSKDTICYGSVFRVKQPNATDGHYDNQKWKGIDAPWVLGRPSIPCHQGVFHRAVLFAPHPFYDESFRIAADSEVVLRELMAGRGKDMDILITKMLAGGISDNKKYRTKLVYEIIRVNWRLGLFFKRPFLQSALLIVSWIKYSLIGIRT